MGGGVGAGLQPVFCVHWSQRALVFTNGAQHAGPTHFGHFVLQSAAQHSTPLGHVAWLRYARNDRNDGCRCSRILSGALAAWAAGTESCAANIAAVSSRRKCLQKLFLGSGMSAQSLDTDSHKIWKDQRTQLS